MGTSLRLVLRGKSLVGEVTNLVNCEIYRASVRSLTTRIRDGILTTRMREMRQDITVVQSCHRNLRNDHFKESRKRREYTEFIRRKAKSGGRRIISAFHDSRWNEDFGMFLVDDFQTSRTLEVTFRNLVINSSVAQQRRTYCR